LFLEIRNTNLIENLSSSLTFERHSIEKAHSRVPITSWPLADIKDIAPVMVFDQSAQDDGNPKGIDILLKHLIKSEAF
jgi:hypothetical protein